MDTFLLKILLAFIKKVSGPGIDFERLKAIAETKVLMDHRRTPVAWRKKQQKESKNPMLGTLIMYAFVSLYMGFLVYSMPSLLLSMIILHAYLMFMMSMTLITDFSTVILDTTDNQIILPKPVTSRTLFLARLVHILVYLLQFSISLIAIPLILIFVKYGFLTGICSILTLLLTVGLSVFVTYLLYALIMRFSNEQKMKDIIGYFQILMTIIIVIGFQLLPRLIDFDHLNFKFSLHWYSYLLPPVWMAMSLDAVHSLHFDMVHASMIAVSILMPIATIWLMIKYLAPSFSRKLGALDSNEEVTKKKNSLKTEKKDVSDTLARLLCSTSLEKAGFEKTWKITARDKNFKIQFYPSVAYILVFAFIFIFKSGKNFEVIWSHLSDTKMYLWFIYLPMLTMATGLAIIPYYENFQASWVYQSISINKPGEIISGSIKVIITKFFIPAYFILFAIAWYIWGNLILTQFLFGLFNNVLILIVIANISDHYLPFSKQMEIKKQSGRLVRMLFQTFLIGLLIALHYLALRISWLVPALIPISAAGVYFLFKRIQNLSWTQMSI